MVLDTSERNGCFFRRATVRLFSWAGRLGSQSNWKSRMAYKTSEYSVWYPRASIVINVISVPSHIEGVPCCLRLRGSVPLGYKLVAKLAEIFGCCRNVAFFNQSLYVVIEDIADNQLVYHQTVRATVGDWCEVTSGGAISPSPAHRIACLNCREEVILCTAYDYHLLLCEIHLTLSALVAGDRAIRVDPALPVGSTALDPHS